MIFIFNAFNQSSKRGCAKYGKYTDLQTYFLEKNILLRSQAFQGIVVPKFQRNRSVLCKMWQGVVIWPQFAIGILQSFIYYKKIWFSDKILKRDSFIIIPINCRNNIHVLGISMAADRNKIAIFYCLLLNRRDQFFVFSQNIYEGHCKVWQQMLLEGHEFSQTWTSFQTNIVFNKHCFRQLL